MSSQLQFGSERNNRHTRGTANDLCGSDLCGRSLGDNICWGPLCNVSGGALVGVHSCSDADSLRQGPAEGLPAWLKKRHGEERETCKLQRCRRGSPPTGIGLRDGTDVWRSNRTSQPRVLRSQASGKLVENNSPSAPTLPSPMLQPSHPGWPPFRTGHSQRTTGRCFFSHADAGQRSRVGAAADSLTSPS